MNARKLLAAAALIYCAAFSSWAQEQSSPELYKLEDTQGRTIEAQILGVEDGQVSLRTKAGRNYTLALDKFSEISQKDILRWQQEGGGSSRKQAESGDWTVNVVSESTEKSIYQTRHFEINTDSLLSANIVSQFTPILEGTYYGLRSLPLGITVEPSEGDRFSVGILKDERSFVVLVGELPASAVGSYIHTKREMLLPISRIGITEVEGAFSVRPVKRNPGLVHETTLLLLQKDIENLPPWLVKGVAEYLAAADYKDKKLSFENHNKNIARHLQEVYKASPKAIAVTPFDRLVGIDYPAWTSASEKDRQSYTLSSLLAVYYLVELDNQGRNLRSYVSALTSGKEAGDALSEALNGRSVDEFSAAMKTGLSRQGLNIRG